MAVTSREKASSILQVELQQFVEYVMMYWLSVQAPTDYKLPSVTTSSLTHLLPVSQAFSLCTPLPFWTFAVTLILNTAIQYFHWTFWLMVIYLQTKKRILSSEAIAETVTSWLYVSPHCDLDDSTPFCWPCDTPVYDSVSPYKVWLQQVQQFRSRTNINWNFECSLWPWL